jgi:hypothetical protein
MSTEKMVPLLSKAEIKVSETKMLTETKSVDLVTEKMSAPQTPLRIRQPSKASPVQQYVHYLYRPCWCGTLGILPTTVALTGSFQSGGVVT